MNNHSRLTTTDDRRLQNSPNYSNKVAVVTGSSTEAVLRAITSKDPDFRYVAGEDAKSIMNIRKNSSDKEFENWVYENVLQKIQYTYARE